MFELKPIEYLKIPKLSIFTNKFMRMTQNKSVMAGNFHKQYKLIFHISVLRMENLFFLVITDYLIFLNLSSGFVCFTNYYIVSHFLKNTTSSLGVLNIPFISSHEIITMSSW